MKREEKTPLATVGNGFDIQEFNIYRKRERKKVFLRFRSFCRESPTLPVSDAHRNESVFYCVNQRHRFLLSSVSDPVCFVKNCIIRSIKF